MSLRLTGTNYKTLAPAEGRRDEIIFDSHVPALGLRVYTSGSGKWIVQYRPKGAAGDRSRLPPKRLVVGDRKVMSLSEAREAALKVLGQTAAGRDPVAEQADLRRRERQTVTFALAAYKQEMERRGIVNHRTVASTLKRGFAGSLSTDVAAITLADLVRMTATIARKSGPGAAADFRSRSSAFLSFAAAQGIIERNPWAGYRVPRASRSERVDRPAKGRALPDHEIAAVWKAATARGDSFGRIVLFLILSGARRGEGAGLRWEWISADWIDLPATFTKQARGHSIPISSGLRGLIETSPMRGALVWPSERRTGGNTPVSGWTALMDDLIQSAKVPRFTPHDLRRTFRTWAEQQGISDAIAETALGHVDQNTLKRVYARSQWRTELIELFEAWSAHLSRVTQLSTN